MKKFISLILSLVMICCVISIPASAVEETIQDTIIMQEIAIDPHDKDQIEQVIITYQLQPETANTIRKLYKKAENNNSIKELNVLIPNPTTRGNRTYKGYGNKTYYEEIVRVEYSSDFVDVGEDNWSNYFDSTVKGVLEYTGNAILNKVTFGIFSISKIFTSYSVAYPNDTITHIASLVENKDIKHTYVVDDGQYYFGSLTEKVVNSHFENRLLIPGNNSVSGKDTSIPTESTPNYNSADEKAYYFYVGGGYTETIDGYWFGGAYFVSAVS